MITSIRSSLATVAACGLLFSAAASAFAGPKDYQFTGPVTAMTDTTFSVTKGKEAWEFAKDASTTAPADLKVGDKVTVHYVMTAKSIEASAAAKAPATKEKTKAGKKAAKADTATATAEPAASGSPSKPAAEATPAATP